VTSTDDVIHPAAPRQREERPQKTGNRRLTAVIRGMAREGSSEQKIDGEGMREKEQFSATRGGNRRLIFERSGGRKSSTSSISKEGVVPPCPGQKPQISCGVLRKKGRFF